MASRWIVNKRGESSLAFRELVGLARCGELTEDDLVKAEWEPDWRPAHSVVGLFYRVRRAELEPMVELPAVRESSAFEAETAFSLDELTADFPLERVGESAPTVVSDPGWMQRYREVVDQRVARASTQPLTPFPTSMQLLADAAVQACEQRATPRDRWHSWQNRWHRFWEFVGSPWMFRMVSAVMVSAIVCFSVAAWSRQSALRFPKPGMPDRYLVPVLGDCTPREFAVVLLDLALVSAVLGYWAASRVEDWAEPR